jgi:hypothetical protein
MERHGIALLFLVTSALLFEIGCFKVPIEPPGGVTVRYLSGDAPVDVSEQYRTWYAFWGLFPLDDTRVADVIQREALTEVRVRTVDSLSDAFASFLYTVAMPIGLVPQTIVVEGNRAGGYTGRAGVERAPHHYDLWIQKEPIERGVPKLKQD